jgi:pimeloyl-ACP methyl ester carboxylesterase
MRRAALVAVAAAALLAGRAAAAGGPALTGGHPCPGQAGYTCSTLTVPLDWRARAGGTLALSVAASDGPAKLGTLLFLTGGPGQPGVPFISRLGSRLGSIVDGYRLVMYDQRGTGAGALQCPGLQHEMGSTDLTVPTRAAVRACARALGPRRRFFSTADTVADIDALRQALGASTLVVDGVSYGTFVAERYALAHPGHVSRLVLDSVVPQAGVPPFDVANAHATARVLRAVCRAEGCRSDPAADLAAVVRRYGHGPQILSALVTSSVIDPTYQGVVPALHDARLGRPAALDAVLGRLGPDTSTPAVALSQGLHASTLCADSPMPWGGPDAPAGGRAGALARAARRVPPTAVWPFDRATVAGNGIVQTCRWWPRTPPPAPFHDRDLPPVPVLLLSGDRDLSTPLAWARAEAARARQGHLVVVAGAGHSVQSRAVSDAGRAAVAAFLHS